MRKDTSRLMLMLSQQQSTSSADDLEQWPTLGGADDFLEFISQEVMPWVEENYRTRPYRILVGHSYGGLFTIHTLTTRPDLFDAYLAISPSLQWSNQEPVAQAEQFFRTTEALQADLFVTVGNEGGGLEGGVMKLAGVLAESTPRGFRWQVTPKPGQSHNSVPYQSTYEGLEAIFEGWFVRDAFAMYEDRGFSGMEAFFERGGARFGYARTMPARVNGDVANELIRRNRLDEARLVLFRDTDRLRPPSSLLRRVAAGYRALGAEARLSELLPRLAGRAPRESGRPARPGGQTINAGPPAELFPLSDTRFYRVDTQYSFELSDASSPVLILDQGESGLLRSPRIE